MTPRPALVSLFAACLLCLPVAASQPYDVAGNLVPNPIIPTNPPDICIGDLTFDWFEDLFPQQLDASETLTLEMAIIPFRSGQTDVALRDPGGEFVGLVFADGLVNGLPYHRSAWNDIAVTVRPATQDYLLTINGVQAGPFPYDSFCQQQGGCFTVQGWRLVGFQNDEDSRAWIDSIFVFRESPAGREPFYGLNFDFCASAPMVSRGGFLLARPPQRFRPRG